MPFQLNNRIDVLDEQDKWLEARVIDVISHLFLPTINFQSNQGGQGPN